MKNKADFVRAQYDIPFFAQTILSLKLYSHQIDMLRSMQAKMHDLDVSHSCGQMPRQTGITTCFIVAAAHHLIYGTDSKKGFIFHNRQLLDSFRNEVLRIVAASEKYFSTKFALSTDTDTVKKGDTVIILKTASQAETGFIGISLDELFIDCVIGNWFYSVYPSLQSSRGRLHIYNTGYDKRTVQAFKSLKTIGNVKEIKANIDEVFSKEQLDKYFRALGTKSFVEEFLCKDPEDPNAIAKYHNEV